MSREAHVQFCESLGVRFPGATHPEVNFPIAHYTDTYHFQVINQLMLAGVRRHETQHVFDR
jgi:hypothetical protein